MAELTRELPGASAERDWLLPGQTIEMSLEQLPSGASVEVIAVVLEDGTSAGDREVIASIFGRRVVEQAALARVVEAFRTVLATSRGVAALRELQARLGPTFPAMPTAERAAAEAVATFLNQAAAVDEETIDQSLRAYAAFVERQHQVAVRHARRTG
jgi:hypothetical protein